MTNKEAWDQYTANLPSPQNYIDWGLIYLVSASLQRRVWIGKSPQQLFPNNYTILVGPPGVGKGLILKPISHFLSFHKIGANLSLLKHDREKHISTAIDAQLEVEKAIAKKGTDQSKVKGSDVVRPNLIPVAAETTTFEALTKSIAESLRRIPFTEFDVVQKKELLHWYKHASTCFVLQELSSLMRKHTHDVMRFLLGLYDCPQTYIYDTKHAGKDEIHKGCINLIAGTIPSFMQDTMSDKLIDEGFSSRTFFIFALRNRKTKFFLDEHVITTDAIACEKQILDMVLRLSSLYGEIKVEPETRRWLDDWWESQEANKNTRKNASTKMDPYYSRKNIHVMKVAMAIHFRESSEMCIPLSTYQEAIEFLEKEEVNMHYAIIGEDKNPIAKIAKKIQTMLMSGPKCFVEIFIETNNLGDRAMLLEAIDYLEETGQMEQEARREDPDSPEEMTVYYKQKGDTRR